MGRWRVGWIREWTSEWMVNWMDRLVSEWLNECVMGEVKWMNRWLG